MDAMAGSLLIANNGPAIEGRDLEHIFERGFSRRPGGRGLGLFISAKALKAEGMTLSIQSPPRGYNVAFQISVPTLTLPQ
jgi:signal transduction histidine kinase